MPDISGQRGGPISKGKMSNIQRIIQRIVDP